MKKILIALTVLTSLIGINSVKAADLTLDLVNYYETYKSVIGEENLNNILNEVMDDYKNTYMTSYPYYIVQFVFSSPSSLGFTNNGYFDIKLFYSSQIPTYYWSVVESPGVGISTMSLTFKDYDGVIARQYHVYENDNFIFDSTYITSPYDYASSILNMNSNSNPKVYSYYPSNYYISNHDLYMPPINSVKSINNSGFIFNYDKLLIPTLEDPTINSVVSYDREDFLIEPYYLYNEDLDLVLPQYTEINLNDYAYVALALKDYQQDPFETTVQVKGQYCLTPVYDHGMKERKDILEGTKVERCSPYYDNYTTVRTSILNSDLQNHAIYYLKAYDTSKDNYVKIDTTVFDVTLITEEEKDNPYVIVDGKTYPTIPYDELTDTATKSEDEGYVSGESEKFDFSNIFTAPLDFLKEIWSTITTFFTLITSFISLLPPILQNFLYASFMLAIALGLIKIIL